MPPKIYYTRLTDYTITASLSANASFPLSNLKTWYEDDLWKSSANTNGQTLVFDFGAAKLCNYILIANGNLASMTTVTLQGDDNAGFSSPETILGAGSLHGTPTYDDATRRIFEFDQGYTYRYFRILFTNTNSTIPEIGQVFLDSYFQFQTSYDWPYRKDNARFNTFESGALDGRIRTSQAYSGRFINQFAFTLQDDDTREGFQTFQQTVRGKLYPWYWLDADEESIYYVHAENDQVDVELTRLDQNSIQQLVMKEQRATRL